MKAVEVGNPGETWSVRVVATPFREKGFRSREPHLLVVKGGGIADRQHLNEVDAQEETQGPCADPIPRLEEASRPKRCSDRSVEEALLHSWMAAKR